MQESKMFKYLIVFLVIVAVCSAQDDQELGRARKKGGLKYKHKYHLLHHSGILYYLAFLAIKVKIVFLIGTMITFAMFAGKFFAYMRSDHHYKSEPEKIYIQSDPHPSYLSSPEYYGKEDHDHYDTVSSGTTSYGTTSYGRDLGDGIFDNVNIFKDIIKRLDLTDFAFESMDMDDDACRKRFICEADFKAKDSSLLTLGMYIFSDEGLKKYRSNDTINAFEDCAKLYASCGVMPEYISVM